MTGDPLDPCNAGAFREAQTGPFYSRDGKQLAAGERPRAREQSIDPSIPASKPGLDPKDMTRPKRRCANCEVKFQPTARRRMLCGKCYRNASGSPLEPDG